MRTGATRLIAFGVLAALGATPAAHAKKVKSKGQVSIESRAFMPDDIDRTDDYGFGVAARLEAKYKKKPFELKAGIFARTDALDDTRAVVYAEDLFVGYRLKPLKMRLRVGYQVLNWTALEVFHPADIINARNYDSRLENPDKFGEPMVELRFKVLEGTVTGYYMPFARAPRLPVGTSRLSPFPKELPIPVGEPLMVGRDRAIDDNALEHQWAVRIVQTLGDADLSFHVVQHMDRAQPTQVVDLATGDVRPVFHFVTQIGGTWQQVIGPLIGKLEVAHREFGYPDPDPAFRLTHREQLDHTQAAFGAEFGWEYGELGWSGTAVVEGQFMFTYDEPRLAEPDLGPFENDVLVGYRHAFNDEAGTLLDLGVIIDTADPSQMLARIRAVRRLGEVWQIEGNARVVTAEADLELEARGLERWSAADEFNLTLTRFF